LVGPVGDDSGVNEKVAKMGDVLEEDEGEAENNVIPGGVVCACTNVRVL
jgi:hypothetical protein